MTGTTTITANISEAQVKAGGMIGNYGLMYFQIGFYIPGPGSSFTVSATDQMVEDALYDFITAPAQDGGLKEAFPNASYTSQDGEALNWLLTGNNSGTFLGADASGQNGYGVTGNPDYAVRLLANYLNDTMDGITAGTPHIPLKYFQSIDWPPNPINQTNQTVTFNLPNPGVYLIIDIGDDLHTPTLPIILSTEPSPGYTAPPSMKNYVTNTIALKDQDPYPMPVKQFVADPTTNSSGDLTGGTLTGAMSATIGAQNVVTYQVSDVFPNINGYPQYLGYSFIDDPGTGMTLKIAKGNNMYVAGIPLTTLVNDGYAWVDFGVCGSYTYCAVYGVGDVPGESLADMPDLVGGPNSQMTVNIDEAGMQYIAAHGYQTSNVNGKKINFSRLSSQAYVSQKVNGNNNTMSGINKGASSYTGQTQPAPSGENNNQASADNPQVGGELFGLTYQAFLNSSVAYNPKTGTTEATNTAQTGNGFTIGSGFPLATNNAPLTTSGTYNGGTTDQSGKKGSTTQTNPDQIHGTKDNGTTDGVPNNTAVGSGLNWMKIWGSGQVAKGASFYVQNSKGDYLYATGSGWGWTPNKVDAEKFQAATLDTAKTSDGTPVVNPAAEGGFFEINGLADGTYTVTECVPATGADPNVLPQFTITLNSKKPEVVNTTAASLNLVNNTPNGTPFFSGVKDGVDGYNTVENVKSLMGLPLTGGAGILTGVIAAVILFGTAGIVLVVYKRRKQQED